MTIEEELDRLSEEESDWYCPYCAVRGIIDGGEVPQVKMEVRRSLLGRNPTREDVMMKCPRCRATVSKGEGITEGEYEDRYDSRGGKEVLDVYRDSISSIDKDHLRDLGYIV